jgi:hypothetical protein
MWISPSYQDTAFPIPHSIDTKITLFEDRVLGWKLNIADQIINGQKGSNGKDEILPIKHAGYAVLDIVFSYFEMRAKYEDGFSENGRSKEYFKAGVYSVFPVLRQVSPTSIVPGIQGNVIDMVEVVLDLMYEGIRCGLYHSGITNGKIMLTGDIQAPMAFHVENQGLIVNPHLLVPRLKSNLAEYVSRLRDINNHELRKKFETRYDFDTRA